MHTVECCQLLNRLLSLDCFKSNLRLEFLVIVFAVYYKLKIPENIKKISLVISAGIPWKNQGQLKTASW
jgi:hypothetical protein